MKIVLTDDDGTEYDVTEAVQIVYDSLHASMDFGSGFLDAGESKAMHDLAVAGGWDPPEYSRDVCECGHTRETHGHGYLRNTGDTVIKTEPRCQTYHFADPGQRWDFQGTSERIYDCECRTFRWATP